MNEAKSRVLNELRELYEKYNKLLEFVFSEKFDSLGEEPQVLLHKQLDIMKNYINVLERRLDIWQN